MFNIDNVSVYLSEKKILESISLRSNSSLIGILGPNGAGKSTLLKALGGFIKKYDGSIKLNAIELNSFTINDLAKIRSYVTAQENINNEFITVYNYLCFGRALYQNFWGTLTTEDKVIIEKNISILGIKDLVNNNISNISSGELQRVQIARALIQEPDILLLDEPTSHLDINYQIKIMTLLKKISEKIKVVCVLHDLNLASHFCEEIILLKKGKLQVFGKTEDVLTTDNLELVFENKWKIDLDENNKKIIFPVYSV